jgi:hypothetical protein
MKPGLLAAALASALLALPAHAISVPFVFDNGGGSGTGTLTEPGASPLFDFSLTLTSNDDGNSNITTRYGAIAPSLIEVDFTWAYFTIDPGGSFFEAFGYEVDGSFVQLTAELAPPAIQSGNSSFIVQPGQSFSFAILSSDGVLGPATATVFGNITVVPLPAGGVLLLSALVALAGLRRRRAA